MKTILILRHAKSDWNNPELADIDRPLAKRGLKDAPRMGKVLQRFNYVPDVILSSPAVRARQTAQLAAKNSGYKNKIEIIDSLYPGSITDLIAALRRLPNTVNRPMVIGHNPALSNTAATLCHYQPTMKLEDVRLPTAGLICFDVDIRDWATLEPGSGVLRWFLIPKLVKALGG